MEAQVRRLLIVLTIILVLIGGVTGILSWSRHDYLQSRWVEMSARHQSEVEVCKRRLQKDCLEIFLAEKEAVSGYLISSYEAQDTMVASFAVAIGGPILLWSLFYLSRWIRTGRWRAKELGK